MPAKGQVTAAAGHGARMVLTACLDAAVRGDIDAVCFAPLNKQAMKKGGMAINQHKKMAMGMMKGGSAKKMMKGGMTSKPKKMMGGGRAMYAKGGMARGCK